MTGVQTCALPISNFHTCCVTQLIIILCQRKFKLELFKWGKTADFRKGKWSQGPFCYFRNLARDLFLILVIFFPVEDGRQGSSMSCPLLDPSGRRQAVPLKPPLTPAGCPLSLPQLSLSLDFPQTPETLANLVAVDSPAIELALLHRLLHRLRRAAFAAPAQGIGPGAPVSPSPRHSSSPAPTCSGVDSGRLEPPPSSSSLQTSPG